MPSSKPKKNPARAPRKPAKKAPAKASRGTPGKTGGDPTVLVRTRISHSRIAAIAFLVALLFIAPLWDRAGSVVGLLYWAGYFALIVGVLGRIWCSAYIGGRKSQIVVDVGPYSMTRNPLYVFSFIGLVGIGLSTGMLLVAVGLAAAFIVYYRGVVAGEETFLTQRHDSEFKKYLESVPRWIPDPRLYREADEPMGLPRNVLITTIESGAFFLAPPLFALIGWLQETAVLPVLLKLP